jgi:hypothetical protein
MGLGVDMAHGPKDHMCRMSPGMDDCTNVDDGLYVWSDTDGLQDPMERDEISQDLRGSLSVPHSINFQCFCP